MTCCVDSSIDIINSSILLKSNYFNSLDQCENILNDLIFDYEKKYAISENYLNSQIKMINKLIDLSQSKTSVDIKYNLQSKLYF